MSKHLTVIVNNHQIINDLFGYSDTNLRTVENLLGVKIFSQGNQIYLETDNNSIKEMFQTIMEQLEDHIRLGYHPDPELIKSIHQSLFKGDSSKIEFLKSKSVIIPKALKKVFPRSYNQALFLDTIDNCEITIGIGVAGTGKTFLAVAQALKSVISRTKRKLILTRPVVEAGESLGFLPGDLEQKINPYLKPLYDAIESLIPCELIKKLEDNGIIEIAPLAYMRGRTLSNCFIILDEAQNTTREQMKMFLTRIGEDSKAIVTGDITQIDLPRQKESGLTHIISVLKLIQEIRFIFFNEQDVVRNPLVRKIVNAYETSQEA